MKKFLSLVLALVMTMSLVTVSAGAKDFTDNSKINYEEAVEVMSTLGVVGGYTDGSFNPQGTLTRGAAAKIICNLILGTTTADALTADAAPYKDVATTNVFAPYIAYCAKEGIISGYADGTFRPANTLTGYAFMKMLLGALGLQADKEGYTGPNWSISVAKRALSKDVALDNGLKGEFNGAKAATREEACLYALNMLKARTFEYPNDSTVIVGNVSVSTSAKATQTKDVYYDTVFKNLDDETVQDDFGRPATKWTYKGVKIGTYAKDADKTYVGSVKLNEIYKDLGMSTANKSASLYVNNGEKAYTVEVSKANDTKLDKVDSKIGDGTLVEVYRNDDTNHVDIVAISVYAGKISNVKAATSKKDAYVVVEESSVAPKNFNDEFETEAFEEDDVVAYTYSDSAKEIKTMYKLESVSGELTKKVIDKSLTLGDTTYKYAKNVGFADSLNQAGLKNKSEYVVYLDANGLALYIEEASFSAENYALVLKITGESGDDWNENKVKLLFSDGSEKTVITDKNYTKTGSLANDKQVAKYDVVRYSVNSDNEYKLTKTTGKSLVTSADFSIKNKKVVNFGADVDSKTIFVVENGDNYDVYTGIKNAPNVSAPKNGKVSAYAYVKDGVAKVIFILGGDTVNTSKNVTFIAGESASKRYAETDTDSYYVYNAVVKGEVTTVMINAGVDNTDIDFDGKDPGALGNVIWNSTTKDSDDIISKGSYSSTTVDVKSGTGVKKVSTDEIKLAGKIQAVASDVNVYLVNSDGDIEAITMSDVKTNSDNEFMYTIEDGEITNLFIIEVED